MGRQKLPPHPRSKEWKLHYKLKVYRGEMLEPYEMSTSQLVAFTRWGHGYLQWRALHRITEKSCERNIEHFEDYVNELELRDTKKRRRKRR